MAVCLFWGWGEAEVVGADRWAGCFFGKLVGDGLDERPAQSQNKLFDGMEI